MLPRRPAIAELASELVVDEVPELVQEAERDPAVAARDAQIDGIAMSKPVAAGLARRRGRAHGHGLEVGTDRVQRVCGCEGTIELRVERAASRQPQDVRERP